MIISFFEEFPSKENLDKLKLIDFNTKLYLAASSFEEFNNIKLKIKNKDLEEIIYWPILKQEEGYWISPFSKKDALIRILNENIYSSVMIDAELPKNKLLYLSQLFNFFENKKLIREFIRKNKTYIAEYYPQGAFKDSLFNILGLNFDPTEYNTRIIKMFYNSMHHFNKNFLREEIKYGVNKYKNRYLVAFGTIATGIIGSEPILSSRQLDKDLKIAEECKVKEVVIFRLGGLNKDYLRIIKKYV